MADWYSFKDIVFSAPQIVWVLSNAELVKTGEWPPEPISSGYTALPSIRKGGRKNARFTKPIEVIAEIERRLEHCGLDGLMAYLYYSYDFDEYLLGKYYRLEPSEVKHRIEAVIWWICGWNFYPRPYRRWHVYRAYENWKEQNVRICVG